MWHEARRQERKIKGMLVDYRKRAERRRDFYEKIKADPTQFLQVHGRQCKVHLDPVIAAAADSAVMMPWQGNENNLIDRFDVRAHLDHIPPVQKDEDNDTSQEERQLNYERYRIIAQNAYLSISEEKFLKQLHLEEQFGYTETKVKKEPKGTGAAIGFNYEEGTAINLPAPSESPPQDNFDDENSNSDLDVDLAINVSKIDSAQAHDLNKHGQQFGMSGNDFYSFLTNDLEEAESYKLAKEEEHEKALYSGRKSRRERRAHREKRLANRKISPPSYAAKESPTNPSFRDESKSPSRSPSPDAGKITYITSFGDEEEPEFNYRLSFSEMVKYGKAKPGSSKPKPRDIRNSFDGKQSRTNSRRSRSRSKIRRSRSRNRYSRSSSRSRRSRPSAFSRDRVRVSPPSKRRRSRSRSSAVRKCRSVSRSRSNSLRVSKPSCSRSRSSSRRHSRGKSNKSRSHSKSRLRSRSRSKERSESSRSSSSLSSSSASKKSKSPSKSTSPAPVKSEPDSKSPEAPAPPRIRYYGRKTSDMSSSESSSSDNDGNRDLPSTSDSNRFGNNSGTMSKKSSTLTVIERLRLKRQALINRQFKKDKIAEVQKILREKQAQQTREDELREMAIKLRRRQRELRHAYDRSSSSDSAKSDSSKKREVSTSPMSKEKERRRSRSRDRSRRDREVNKKSKRSRSSSPSSRRADRHRDKRGRSPDAKDTARKLVDY
uniref:Suppressor of white apricot N-terminal domain-containing protein n=1 Tax=Dendroctonus ponderosae TaxID=77166 RepID=A0AAR5P7M8_DENPD